MCKIAKKADSLKVVVEEMEAAKVPYWLAGLRVDISHENLTAAKQNLEQLCDSKSGEILSFAVARKQVEEAAAKLESAKADRALKRDDFVLKFQNWSDFIVPPDFRVAHTWPQ